LEVAGSLKKKENEKSDTGNRTQSFRRKLFMPQRIFREHAPYTTSDSLIDITANVSTEGADRKISVLGCFQRIPNISVSSSPIHIKTK
jgi:hypothetical protein